MPHVYYITAATPYPSGAVSLAFNALAHERPCRRPHPLAETPRRGLHLRREPLERVSRALEHLGRPSYQAPTAPIRRFRSAAAARPCPARPAPSPCAGIAWTSPHDEIVGDAKLIAGDTCCTPPTTTPSPAFAGAAWTRGCSSFLCFAIQRNVIE